MRSAGGRFAAVAYHSTGFRELAQGRLPVAAQAGGGLSTGSDETVPGSKAKLVGGRAIAPANAPKQVQKVIDAEQKSKGEGGFQLGRPRVERPGELRLLARDGAEQLVHLTRAQQKLARPARLVIVDAGLLVGGNVRFHQPGLFAVLDIHIRFLDAHLPGANRLDLGAEDQPSAGFGVKDKPSVRARLTTLNPAAKISCTNIEKHW